MKLYDGGKAPNPRRVRIFFAEKNLPLPQIVPVNLAAREHYQPSFLALNPLPQIPVLVLDDGTAIAETMAICRYIEALHPRPSLFGDTPRDIGLIEMWNRRIEWGLHLAVASVFRHGHPAMAGFETPQVAEWAQANRPRVFENLALLDRQLDGRAFICGDRLTVADITAGVAVDFMKVAKLALPEDLAHVRRWIEALRARPSWAA